MFLYNYLSKILIIVILVLVKFRKCQIINRPPQFVPGSGDMSRFSLSENTPVGSPVYQLKGKHNHQTIIQTFTYNFHFHKLIFMQSVNLFNHMVYEQ